MLIQRWSLQCAGALCSALALGSLTACAPWATDSILVAYYARLGPTDLQSRVYPLVDDMLTQDPVLLPTGGPIVVGSVADIRDVNRTTPLGNTIAELVRSRLVQRHITVTDLRLRSEILLDRSQGELTLSRDSRAVHPPPRAAEIMSGTYAVGTGTVYVSLKIIAATDARILAAGDFVLPRTADVDRLLDTGSLAER